MGAYAAPKAAVSGNPGELQLTSTCSISQWRRAVIARRDGDSRPRILLEPADRAGKVAPNRVADNCRTACRGGDDVVIGFAGKKHPAGQRS